MSTDRVLGLIPAAGRATRMGKLPCSKEILPLGLRTTPSGIKVRVLADELMDQLNAAGIRRAIIATDPVKTDIERYYGEATRDGIGLNYIYTESTSTVHTINACYSHIRAQIVAFGFPDILLPPSAGFTRLLEELAEGGHDAVIGLFAAAHPQRVDMVLCDSSGALLDIAIKEEQTPTGYMATWALAVWNPAFTEHLHQRVSTVAAAVAREPYVGDMLIDALQAGLRIQCVELSSATCMDAGTPESYARAFTVGSKQR